MVTVHYRRWCPPQSPLRIEFLPQLLHDVRLKGGQPVPSLPQRWIAPFKRVITQSSGLLFGVRNLDEVRLLSAQPHIESANPDGFAPLGIFVCRARGEVFLTDDDLATFEKHRGILALVIAGGQAGFFVREPDGSVQAIRSHEEFRMADAASRPVSNEPDPACQLPIPAPRCFWKRGAACAALLTVPAGAFAYWQPMVSRLPIALALREEAGQLVIGWNPVTGSSRLEIRDGSDLSVLMLPANTSSATFGPQSRNVEVRLSTDTRTGATHWEAPRFQSSQRMSPASSALQDRIGQLTREAEDLRRSLEHKQMRTRELAEKMEKLTATPER